MQMKPGDRVGDYEILGTLGAGGMGSVYKVRNVISDRVEAMKVLLPNLAEHQELKDRFLREIKTSASLEHTNIAGLRTAFQSGDMLLMVMEYVEGRSLDTLLRNGPLPVEEAIRYTSQTLDALEYAHSRGVVHRDIKPANIMITPRGTAKLLDFGIAKATSDKTLTMAGTTMGSLFYMSPEQIRGEQVDARADLYSLGITLYELVTGKRPFGGDSGYAIMAEHLQKQPVPPVELDSRVPQALNNVILRALAKSAADRYPSAAAFRQELAQALDPGAKTTPYEAEVTMPRAAVASAPAAAPPPAFASPAPEMPKPQPQPRQPAPSAQPMPAMAAADKAPEGKKPSNTLALAMIGVIAFLALAAVLLVFAGSWLFQSSGTAVAKEESGLIASVGRLFSSGEKQGENGDAAGGSNEAASSPAPDPLTASATPSVADPESIGADSGGAVLASSAAASSPADATSAQEGMAGAMRGAASAQRSAAAAAKRAAPSGQRSESTPVVVPSKPSAAESQQGPTASPSQPAYQSPPAYGQPSGSYATPAPRVDPKVEAETRDLFSKLAVRAGTIEESARKLSQEQSAMGVSLRADIRSTIKRMEYLMDQTEAALNKGDLDTAKTQMGYAEREVEKLEKFFGI